MRKTKAEAQKTRELLLQTALDTFLEHGVSKTTLQTIAKNAGVTRGALYWHFKNKEDLLGTLLQQCFDSFQSSFSDDPDTLAPLCQALKNLFTHLQHNNQQRKLCIILNLKCEHTEENRAITELHRRYIDLWRQRFHNLLQ
ncbi:MAG: TetR family transcriptional regulator, partial [Neisseria sp.]|nr:TetR family transcriptional regulator [Neisseria sp.]